MRVGIEPIVVELLDAGVIVNKQVIVAAALRPRWRAFRTRRAPATIGSLCANTRAPHVAGRRDPRPARRAGLNVSRRDTAHNRSIYQRVRRQMLTHILQMSTNELVEM